ncbi:MAG: GAF domain-containing protein [Phormidesmis sp.]
MTYTSHLPIKDLEELVHRMTDRIRRSLELPEILEATVDELRRFLKVDRVMVYRFHEDDSGEVVAEAIKQQRLPVLLHQRFPADDIPEQARERFLAVRQRSIVNIHKQEIGISPLLSEEKQAALLNDVSFRTVDPCHVDYLTAMGVQASLVVPILHRHRLWGLLVAHHSTPRRFGNRELEIVQLIADQVTVAIAHASLLQLTRLQGQHESIINKTVSQLHSTGNNPLQSALSQIVSALHCVGGRLFIPTDYPGSEFWLVSEGKQPAALPASLTASLTHAISSPTVLEQQPDWQVWLKAEAANQIVTNLWAVSDIERSTLSSTVTSALIHSHIRGVLVAKLVHQNHFLGYLSLFRQAIDIETIWAGRPDESDSRQQRPRESFEAWREIKKNQAQPWHSREIGLVQDLADRFASVVYQMQLYEKVQTLNASLEERVSQRTAQLEQANESLKQEMAERERAFQALQEARDALKRLGHQNELILNAAGEGIYGIDPKGKIVFVNPAAIRALGRPKAKVINHFMHDLINHSKPDGTVYSWQQSPIFKTLKHGQTHHVAGDLFFRQDNQPFPVEYVSTSIQEKGNIIGAVVIFQDITERQAIETMRDEFIAVVSHELRTPLTSIRAALGLLAQAKLEIPASQRQRMVEIAFSNTNRLVRLVSDILDVERIKLGKITLNRQTCDLADIMTQSADEMRAMADNHHIQLSVLPLSAQLNADRDRIMQTFSNLFSNAIKFSPAGTTVWATAQQIDASNQSTVESSLSPKGKEAIQSTLAQAPALALIQVKDQGNGIPEDKLEDIFTQFEQLNTSDAAHQGGTGLGLAICRSIVQQHQGEMWAESTPNVGSRLFFTLPLLPAE